jgi:hypothetical protein
MNTPMTYPGASVSVGSGDPYRQTDFEFVGYERGYHCPRIETRAGKPPEQDELPLAG